MYGRAGKKTEKRNKKMSHKKAEGKNKPKNKKKSFWTQKNVIIIVFLVIALAASYFLFFRNKSGEPEFVKDGELRFLSKDTKQQISKINIEAAIDREKQMQGLMYRSHMDEDKGMLFIYPNESREAFWMKNTLIPLDIAFIDGKGQIDTIYRNAVPLDTTALPSRRRIQFVVETSGGYSNRHGVKEGDLIEYKLDKSKITH